MFAFELQPWTTLQGASTTPASPITQSEPAYLDTSRFLDAVIWLETKSISVGASSLYCAFQTSASKDEALFVSMNDTSAAGVAMSVGVQVFILLRDTAQYPLMHWLRWQIIPPATIAWSVTFRLWASLSRPGAIVDGEATDESSFNNGFEGGPNWTDAPPLMGTAPGPSMPDNITHKQSNPKIGMRCTRPRPCRERRLGARSRA